MAYLHNRPINQLTTQLPAKRDHKLSGADIKRAVELRLKGIGYADIGKTMGVSRQAIHQALKPLLGMLADTSTLQAYQDNKGSIMDAIQAQLAGDMLDKGKRAKATLGNVAYALRQLNDISRLEADKSTVNVAHAHVEAIATVQEVDTQIANITEQLPDNITTDSTFQGDKAVGMLDSEIARITGQAIDITDD